MKRTLLIIAALLFTAAVYAQIPGGQQRNNALPPPLPSRQVSGIVKDSTDNTVPGAVVKLVSTHDTLSTATNADGIFIFKSVKMNIFTITVTSLGNAPYVKKFQMNDAVPRLTLDPVILKGSSTMIKEVVINGTPTITYKPDTMQYRATDYKVRPNATLDELLKKMEGMEVGSDGSLTHQGQAVTKVKLNGKDYAGGDVAQAIQNLPADIIEYAQVIDDYGDQAARTGIKTGDPTKTLNVTTKADRSVGTTARLIGQAGNYDQYNANIFAQRINANQQLGLIGNFRNAITGIQSTAARGLGGGGGGNPGTTKSLQPLSLNYRDQYSPKVQVVSSATYNFSDNTSTSDSYGTRYNNFGNNIFKRNGDFKNNRNGRSATFELDYQIDSLNYLQVTPSYNYSTSETFNDSFSDNVNDYTQTGHGFEHQTVTGTTSSKTPNTNYGLIAFFNHRFKKPRRNFSFQASYNHTDSESNGETVSLTNNYADATTNNLLLSQSAHLLTYKTNNADALRGSMTYSEPLGQFSQFEFNGQVNRNSHDTKNATDSILTAGGVKETNLNFNYITTETNLNFNYRYNGSKVNLSLGTTLKPYSIEGTKFNNTIGANVNSSLYNFRIIPLFRFAYSWSRTQRFTLNYNGNNAEPAFDQIQPFTDKTDPNNYVTGNPNLRAGLTNNITATYNNYFPNSRFNLSFNGNATFYTDQVASNTTQIFVPIPGSTQQRTIRDITYVNISGARSYGGNYNISKQLADRRYNIAINGGVNYGYSINMNQGQTYHQTSWNFNERFGPRINPSDNVEINPFFGTSLTKTFSTAENSPSSKAVNNSFGLDGRFYFLKTFQVHYDASKNFTTQTSSVTGIPTLNNSPLLINGGFQKEFGQKRSFTLTFDVNDILHQANPLTQTVSATGITNTVTSTKSRYFLVGFRLNLQKWSGRPTRNGRTMQRRGDGSFIYN
ncbi:outer membrane beta-barrel protein [Mucilaginibacter mali]|uniref:Outer membrane beta-barrel protein n=1 Tax=Mucilaginibacter mali TaxID=2740462 RepID=A0A7D4UMC5_9SPHI|nr:outer membrane beta-barrel protein [Mucilaginibacter mali]QKJ30921.1 outer membrane beta-barrel protein [Mucilaginibacter mali]